jgi:UDP-N-acetylmuramate--alanine ligase
MIYEGCEYKDSFLRFAPTISVGLNLELDHTDYFESLGAMKDSFRKALGKATAFSVINGDDENLRPIIPTIKSKVITYGMGERNKYRYAITSFKQCGFGFTVSLFGEMIEKFELNIPGVFNVGNAVAAIVCALEFGIDSKIIAKAIAEYRGIPRRLEYVGDRFGRKVFYDYAHHPTEMRASINAVKMLTHDLVTVIFKPHTYTRTKMLWEDFRMALSLADHVILTDIYPARETNIYGVSSSALSEAIASRGLASVCAADFADAAQTAQQLAGDGDLIIVMGAGDVIKTADILAENCR